MWIWPRSSWLPDGRKAALPVINEAIDLYERKGNLVSAARARALRQ